MQRDAALERLRRAPWLVEAQPFFACLDGANGRTRAVGGIVRDTLLGIEEGQPDIDMATELLPDQVAERGFAAGMNVHPTGADHGTMTLVHEGRAAEITTLRRDVETFGRKARVVFGTDWAEDASRRDFTMNALYCGPDGEIFDPLGGLDDCLAGRVRFIGDADWRIAEDRLRVYRYFRFVVSHGNQRFDTDAIAACRRAAGHLDALSAERVGHEMIRLLSHTRCAATLTEMNEIGILPSAVFPAPVFAGLAQLEALPIVVDADMRLAVMGISGVDTTILKSAWRLPNATMSRVERLMAAADFVRQDKLAELADRYPQEKKAGLAIFAAVENSGESWLADRLDTIDKIEPGAFPLSGSDLISVGYMPGPALGTELQRLEGLWIESGFAMNRAELLELARLS